MAKTPTSPKKPGKTPKSKAPNSKASRPDVEPLGPALADLLNPAINRGDAGMGSGTGLKPPPDNSWDRRAGGEAAAHRARASTRGASGEVAKRDAASSPPHAPSFPSRTASSPPHAPSFPSHAPSFPSRTASSPPRASEASGGERSGVGGTAEGPPTLASASPRPSLPTAPRGEGQEPSGERARGLSEAPQREFAPANYGTAATIPTL